MGKLNLNYLGKWGTSSSQLSCCSGRYNPNLCMVCPYFAVLQQCHGSCKALEGCNGSRALMQLNNCSVHQPFFVKCPSVLHFLLLPFGHFWKLVRKRCLSNLQLGGELQVCRWRGARYIISLFPLMNPSSDCSGLEQPGGPCCVVLLAWCWRGGHLPSPLFLSAWSWGEQECPRPDVQMEMKQVPPKSLSRLAGATLWLLECCC